MTKGEETKQFILEKSAHLFNTKGIAATVMSDVLEATKLSKGCHYIHFKDKDDLACSAAEYCMEQLGSKLTTAISQSSTATGKLFTYIDVLGDVLNPPVEGGCPLLNFGMEADDTNKIIREKVNLYIEVAIKIIKDIIRTGIKNGEFKATWNYDEFAIVMFALVEGGVFIGRVAGNNSRMKIIAKQLKNMIREQVI